MESITDPAFEIFEKPTRDDSVTEFEYVEYLPRDTNTLNNDGQLISIETKDLDEYLLPHKAVLEIRGRLKQAGNGADYDADDNITLCNNGWSLFRSVEYQMNNQIVESISQYAPVASTIMNLVQFSDDYGRSTATNMLWYKDTSTGAAVSNEFPTAATALPTGTVANNAEATGAQLRTALDALITKVPEFNHGFASRKAVTTGDKDTCMFLPLSSILGCCKDIDTVFMGVKHTLQLTREHANNYIHRAAGVAAGKFKIEHISLWMPKIRPSIRVVSQLESKLVKGYLRDLYFEQSRIYRTQYGSSQTSPSWRITTNSNEELPTHIFIAFQASARDGNQEKNNQVFDNALVKSISVFINSERYPERELETNFDVAKRNYGRAYMMFQEAVQKYADTDSGSQVSIEDFASLYTIFHFDVSKHREKLRNSSADIEARWRLARKFQDGGADASYNVYCLVLSERFLKLEAMSGKMNVIV